MSKELQAKLAGIDWSKIDWRQIMLIIQTILDAMINQYPRGAAEFKDSNEVREQLRAAGCHEDHIETCCCCIENAMKSLEVANSLFAHADECCKPH